MIWENGTRQDTEILSVIRQLPELPGFPVRTVPGLSNLTTGHGPLEKACLSASGLSAVRLNIFHHETVSIVRGCSSLTSPKVFAWEEIF